MVPQVRRKTHVLDFWVYCPIFCAAHSVSLRVCHIWAFLLTPLHFVIVFTWYAKINISSQLKSFQPDCMVRRHQRQTTKMATRSLDFYHLYAPQVATVLLHWLTVKSCALGLRSTTGIHLSSAPGLAWFTVLRWCHFLPMWEIGHAIVPAQRTDMLGEKTEWGTDGMGLWRWRNMLAQYVCVNGTLGFTFPISPLMICLRLLPWRSALLPYPSLITWEQHAPQVHLMAPLFPHFLLKFIILIA